MLDVDRFTSFRIFKTYVCKKNKQSKLIFLQQIMN